MICQKGTTVDRVWAWLCRLGLVLVVVLLVHPDAAQQYVVDPRDDGATHQDWILQGQVSIVEDAATRPYRWLLATPKDPVATLNRSLDLSLLRTTVVLAQWVGMPVWQRTTVILQHDAATTVTVRGATGSLEFPVGPQLRRYTVVLPYGFHPVQDHIEPLTTTRYDGYGFNGSTILSSPDDARPRIARWYGTEVQTYLPMVLSVRMFGLLVLPLLGAWLWSRRQPWWVEAAVALLCVAPWALQRLTGAPVSIEPLMTMGVAVLSCLIVTRLSGPLPPLMRVVITATALGLTGMHAYATSYWMQGVDLAAIPSFAAFVSYVGHMRMAMPIPLLGMEYLLVHSGVPGVYAIGYLTIVCRIAVVVGLVCALPEYWTTARRIGLGACILVLCIAGIGFVFRFYDRNVWMVYDALLGTSLVLLARALGQLDGTYKRFLVLGLLLAWLDSLRPFMMVLVPLVLMWVVLSTRNLPGRASYGWLLFPLLGNLLWHTYHIVVLDQWSSSSHAGMNIARAWIPADALTAMRQAPPDMNSSGYLAASNALTAQTLAWIGAHPLDALQRAGQLLWAMLAIPVEMSRLNDGGVYTVISHPAPVLVWGYRVLMMSALVLQGMLVLTGWQREENGVRRWRQGIWLHAVLVVMIIGITALSEYGEQARFVAAMVPALVYGTCASLGFVLRRMQRVRKTV